MKDDFWVKVKVYNIDYCVEEEDVCEDVINDLEIEEDSEEYYDAINNMIKEVKSLLPKELELEVNYRTTIDDLEEQMANGISDKTGWLVNTFNWCFMGRINK